MTQSSESQQIVDLSGLVARLRLVASERDWEPFHTPRNLGMALSGEVGELLAEMQWLSDEQIIEAAYSSDLHRRIRSEVADVLIYLVRLSDVLRIDLDSAVRDKLDEVEARYRPDEIRGSSEKR